MAALPERGFTVALMDGRVIRFAFLNFQRRTVDAWVEYVLGRDGKFKEGLRVLYDMRQPGLPTPYLTQMVVKTVAALHPPDGTLTAYVVNNSIQLSYYQLLAARMPANAGLVRVFKDEAQALRWLRADG